MSLGATSFLDEQQSQYSQALLVTSKKKTAQEKVNAFKETIRRQNSVHNNESFLSTFSGASSSFNESFSGGGDTVAVSGDHSKQYRSKTIYNMVASKVTKTTVNKTSTKNGILAKFGNRRVESIAVATRPHLALPNPDRPFDDLLPTFAEFVDLLIYIRFKVCIFFTFLHVRI